MKREMSMNMCKITVFGGLAAGAAFALRPWHLPTLPTR